MIGYNEKGGKEKSQGLTPYSTPAREDVECVICFIDMKDSQSATSTQKGQVIRMEGCGHKYHVGCLSEWRKR